MFRQTRMAQWRREPVNCKIERPTRIDAARRLGYKAKQGFAIFRTRVRRGDRKRPVHKGIVNGKPGKSGMINASKFVRNIQNIAEERVGKRCGNLRVLNSYWVANDGMYKYYEVIMVDTHHKAIRTDPRVNWLCAHVHKHRELRGLTSAGRQGRGLRTRNHGASKLRPSKRASWKRNMVLSLKRYR